MLAHLGCLDSRAHRTSPISSSPSVSLWRAAAKGKTEFAEADAGRRKVRIKNAASCGLPHTSATSVAALAAAGRAAASRPACIPTREGRGLPRRLQQRRWNGWRRLAAHRPPLPASTTSAAGCDGASRHAHDQRRLPKQNKTAQSPTAQITGPPLSPVSFNHVRQEKINHVSGVLRS